MLAGHVTSSSSSMSAMKQRHTAAMHTALPAMLLGDVVLEIPKSKSRLWVRGFIVFAVIATVVGLTVAKYLTDASLRNDVNIERKTSGFTPTDAQHGVCPCKKIWIPFGRFMRLNGTVDAALTSNAAAYLKGQCSTIVSSSGFGGSGAGADMLYARDAATSLCLRTMLIIVPVIRNQTDTETVVSPSLLVPAAAQRAYQIYAGNTVVAQLRAALLAFNGLQTVAAAVQRRAACRAANSTAGDCSEAGSMITAVASLDAATANDTAIAQAAIKEVSGNILATFGDAGDPGAVTKASDALLKLVGSLATVDWEAYKEECAPLYCDVFSKKNALTRGVEFLAVIGGLWNSCLFVGIVMWTFVMLVLRFDDHTYVYPT